MGPPSRSMFIRDLPGKVIRELESQLNVDNRWTQLVDNIPKYLDQEEFTPKYTALHRSAFAQLSLRPDGNPTRSVIYEWGCQNPTLHHLIETLQRANLLSSARYLIEDFLHEESTPPPPANQGCPRTDLPPISIDILPSEYRRKHVKRFQNVTFVTSARNENVNTNHDSRVDLYGTVEEVGGFESLRQYFPEAAPRMEYAKKKFDNKSKDIHSLLTDEPVISREVKDDINYLHCVSFGDLRAITDDFNEADVNAGGRVIGRGGFGTVFLGIDHDKKRVAVKKTFSQSQESVKQFRAEIRTLSQHRHVNILPLLAYSCDTEELCIVYDYMPAGSLEDRLACKGGSRSLPPALRIDIASGTAHGIHYLNSHGLVHRDVKSANVLLDEKFTAKLGDFATIRPGPSGAGSTVNMTETIIGTPAYLAPEAQVFDVSTKLDSFAFGVVLLELLTGLPAFARDRENRDLKSHCLEAIHHSHDILDRSGGAWTGEASDSLLSIAKRCLHTKKKKRVTVSEIIAELDAL